jgi:hypothetical protein
MKRVAERLKKDHFFWSRAKIEELIWEYRKFLTLVLLSEKQIPMCNKLVDEVWHTHVLFTQDYADFCQGAFGGFIHHEPEDGTVSNSSSVTDFISEHRRIFGTMNTLWFGSGWTRFLGNFNVSRKLCLPTGHAKICVPAGKARLCLPTGVSKAV